MASEDYSTALNSCPYIFLVSHEEAPDTLDLRLVVHEARAEAELSQIDTGNAEVDQILGHGFAVRCDPSYREFTITFENYVGFSIRNESYVNPEPNEDYSKKLRSYTTSTFLDFIASSTFAQQYSDEPILHFAVVCSDHVVDVACTAPPAIEMNTIAESSRPTIVS
ncbi:hypothetical protein [Ruegeria lacuscaerulensis]|uniref:hypothetical protein n=1 Tax=Ruegeria lacuscaerulensis TaxID=55218 RepID=UPI0014808ECA|nr:hypothetical protein [Ruegeria lacuscaerulensis]